MKIELASTDDFELALSITGDEEMQNQNLNEVIKDKVLAGKALDFIGTDDESFGLSAENPVPVNGPWGELTYLSRLRTGKGSGFFFHRLGSQGLVDKFELLSFDGSTRLNVFMDMYHPRRSRKSIHGFWLEESPSVFTGFTMPMPAFPFDFGSMLDEIPPQPRLGYATLDQVMPYLVDLKKEAEPAKRDFGMEADQFLASANEQKTKKLNTSQTFNWRALVDPDEYEKSQQLRGFIVPTADDALRVYRTLNGVYGWPVSKAKAKRMKMDPDAIHDPGAVVVIEGYQKFLPLLSEVQRREFSLTASHIIYDSEGFYSTFISNEKNPDFPLTKAFMEYFTEFYAPFRTYVFKKWISITPGNRVDGSDALVRLNFRWVYEVEFLRSEYSIISESPIQMHTLAFKLHDNGSLDKL